MGINIETWRCGPPPASGQKQRYPARFLYNLGKHYPYKGKKILTMFSGSSNLGVTTDIRKETGADYICPYDDIPLPDNSFDIVIADPPYTVGYSFDWKIAPKDLPKPKRILKEAARLARPGALIFILHILIIPAYKTCGVKRVALHPILTGPNNAIRVLNVFKKKGKGRQLI